MSGVPAAFCNRCFCSDSEHTDIRLLILQAVEKWQRQSLQLAQALAWAQVSRSVILSLTPVGLRKQRRAALQTPHDGMCTPFGLQDLVLLTEGGWLALLQVEDIKEQIATAEDKLEKLQAMGGHALEAALADIQAEVEAQTAEGKAQVCGWSQHLECAPDPLQRRQAMLVLAEVQPFEAGLPMVQRQTDPLRFLTWPQLTARISHKWTTWP